MTMITRVCTLALLASVGTVGGAQAGGLEANGYNWDLLFDAAPFATKGTVTNVSIDHDIQSGGSTVATSMDRTYYNVGIKADFVDNGSCLVSVQNPFGSGTERDASYATTTTQAVSERIKSNDVGLTCAYGFTVGPGVLSVIGGVSAQSLDYHAVVPLPPTPFLGTIDLDGHGMGWRAGLAYEVPEIALRVSAIYNADIDYDLEGTFSASAPFGTSDATAEVTTPQSIEIKAQSGIAPGWLALGSVKWVDWSVLQTLSVDTGGLAGTLDSDLTYRDGWTVTAGVAHVITPELTVLGTVTWDQGTSATNDSGVLLNGAQTDRWGATLGAAYSLSDSVELSGGVSYSTIASGSNLDGESWDNGSVLAFSASLKASF